MAWIFARCRFREARRRVGYVPQDAVLFAGTIRENLNYGYPEASEEELADALRPGACR